MDHAKLSAYIRQLTDRQSRPFIVAIDGRSGAGKSTLSRILARDLHALVIEGDDFYAGGTCVRTDEPASRAANCIDWTRQRCVLEKLASGQTAQWRAFDWDAFDGRLCDVPTIATPHDVVIIEGVYAGRPDLADLLDLRVILTVPEDIRVARLLAREGSIGAWERQWHEAENHYFEAVMPAANFDIIVSPPTA